MQDNEINNPKDDPEAGEQSTMIAPKAKVVFVDDDDTPVDFVLYALERFLGYDEPQAQQMVKFIAKEGEAVVAELSPVPAQLAKRSIDKASAAAGWQFEVRVETVRTL